MRIYYVLAAGLLTGAGAFAQGVTAGDARHGAELFQSEGCVKCHSMNGQGGTSAPDLAKRMDRNFTPASLVSLMWNHAPDMWSGMKAQGIAKAQMPPSSAADLMAYFLSARFFEKPGDAGRGKALFDSRHCSECHGLTQSKAAGAKAVAEWQSLSDPVAMVHGMWTHAQNMRTAFQSKGLKWQELTAQELTDILVYLQNQPGVPKAGAPSTASSGNGPDLVKAKCGGCHTGRLALEKRLKNQTITDIAVDMWNHAPKMGVGAPSNLTLDEMRSILQTVWARQYFSAMGSAGKGKKVFADKQCASCHNGAAAPNLAGKGPFTETAMISVLWDHGPRMLDQMKAKSIAWPRFDGSQMSDLIAYLNTLK